MRAFRLTMKRLGEPLVQVFVFERPQHDFLHGRTALADHREFSHQRMRRVDLVVPVRADDEEVLRFGLDQDVL